MRISLTAALIMIALGSCTTVPLSLARGGDTAGGGPIAPPAERPEAFGYSPDPAIAAHQAAVAEAAHALVGSRRLVVDGTRYNYDCSGTILAIHAAAGTPLDAAFAAERGNGVARIYAIATSQPWVGAPQEYPAVGDIIFWDDTYDRNGDGRWNDELTHAGIVTAVAPDGTITYVHHHYRLGVVAETMNLMVPDDQTRNSAMRMRGQRYGEDARWLASHLYRRAGSAFLSSGDLNR